MMNDLPPPPSLDLLQALCPFRPLAGCPQLLARQAQDVFALWQAWEKESHGECPVPYWATAWPAARLLARYLLEHPHLVTDKEVLEIGCGGAVASIAAKKAGAKSVTANDLDPVAIGIAEENARANRVELLFDQTDCLQNRTLPQTGLILLADFFYLKTDSLVLTGLLQSWKQQSLEIIIADAGRAFMPVNCREKLCETWMDVDSDLEGKTKRRVRIMRY